VDYRAHYAARILFRSMSSLKAFFATLLVSLLLVSVAAQSASVSLVKKVSVLSQTPLQIQIETSRPASPQVQMVANPERLVIDIPDSIPGPGLRGLGVNQGDVRGIRVSLYSAKPPITRVVVDLNAPEWYHVTPNNFGLVVSLGSSGESAGSAQPVIGWVSAKVKNVHAPPVVLRRAVATTSSAPVTGVTVEFGNGLLAIHARNATLSEVLFQIQKGTGAEIAIPSGTEQDRVSADFGPGTPSEVMAQLLNGSGLNFVVVGSPSNPNQLRSVLLSRKTGGADPPSAFEVSDNPPPPTAPVIDPRNLEDSEPTSESGPQQPVAPTGPPPPEPN
jgi:hypothetical protein